MPILYILVDSDLASEYQNLSYKLHLELNFATITHNEGDFSVVLVPLLVMVYRFSITRSTWEICAVLKFNIAVSSPHIWYQNQEMRSFPPHVGKVGFLRWCARSPRWIKSVCAHWIAHFACLIMCLSYQVNLLGR